MVSAPEPHACEVCDKPRDPHGLNHIFDRHWLCDDCYNGWLAFERQPPRTVTVGGVDGREWQASTERRI